MGLELFNKWSRPRLFQRLSGEQFDLLVIGGGVIGASIFRDAALRGMTVALIEANDFAAGTSGRSSKLFHGGLRYLKNRDFRLTWEACRERNLHIRLNRRLVQPWPFLLPLYRGQGESRTMVRLGMLLYEMMSGFKNHRWHRFFSREETLGMAPGLLAEALIGSCLYYDAIVSDNRWTMETVKDGMRHSGLAVNHAPVITLLKSDNKVIGVTFRDQLSGVRYEARARAVVNATGVWVDRVRRLDRPDAPNLLRLSKGTHLVFGEEDLSLEVSMVFTSPVDRRPLFLVKRDGCFLYGTTDDWEDGDPGIPMPGEQDVDYLLESLRRFMPDTELGRERVRFVYSGFRPLLSANSQDLEPSSVSREDVLEVAPSGLITVVGGKLTTARLIAIRVLDRVVKRLGHSYKWLPCRTHSISIGGSDDEIAEGLSYWVRLCPQLAGYFRTLYQRYGIDAYSICAEAMKIFLSKYRSVNTAWAELRYICRSEMVCTLEDLAERRIGFLDWNSEMRLGYLRHEECIIRDELDMSQEEYAEQYRNYQKYLRQSHTLSEKALFGCNVL
ncbi:FAD-dependent oxidoreductase [Chloroflexota bacterium]